MTDPTIPELVARLRELHAKLQALQVGTPEFTAARQLFRDALQLSAPTLLDALEQQTSGDCGGVEQGDNPGVSYLRTVANNLRLRGGTITFTAPQLETVLAGLGAHSPDGGKVELPEGEGDG